ncbi:MAG: hypothetical protein FWD54_07235 [Endomicrobia bacterium]|nr:hypothetical protein [Endomicrobiia bacterium]MCL2800046.1 hypothetical protein [Endomicrobiia bacterium]
MTKKYRTDFLFNDNNFLIGMGSAFNLCGNFFDYNESEDGSKADAKAIENDWGVIGQDLSEVLSNESK